MKDDNYRLIMAYILVVSLFIMTVFMCSSCSTTKQSESTFDYHLIERMMERTDSMIHSTATWQQSIFKQQTSLVDSFKSREVRDTSHTYFLGAKGDTIKEKVIIREYIEKEHNLQENTETYWEERFHKTDSLLQLSLEKQNTTDSLLHAYQKTTVVEKQAPWYERAWHWLSNVFSIIFIVWLLVFLTKLFIKK